MKTNKMNNNNFMLEFKTDTSNGIYKVSPYEVNTILILNIQNIRRQGYDAAHDTSHFSWDSQKKNLRR
jgi:hypothetical protein